MQQLAYMAGVMVHPKLFLQNPSNYGRGPNSRIQAIGDRTAVQDIAQLLPLPRRQLSRSARALPLEQAFHAVRLKTSQPFGHFGTRSLKNFGQLSAGKLFATRYTPSRSASLLSRTNR